MSRMKLVAAFAAGIVLGTAAIVGSQSSGEGSSRTIPAFEPGKSYRVVFEGSSEIIGLTVKARSDAEGWYWADVFGGAYGSGGKVARLKTTTSDVLVCVDQFASRSGPVFAEFDMASAMAEVQGAAK